VCRPIIEQLSLTANIAATESRFAQPLNRLLQQYRPEAAGLASPPIIGNAVTSDIRRPWIFGIAS
jgi:hypothetical protein